MKMSAVLEEQRQDILHEAAYELSMQERKPCKYRTKFGTKMQRTSEELSGRNYDCGNSSGRQALLFPELHGREEVHQAALTDKLRSSFFFKKKKKGWTETNLREETKADAVTQEDKREDPENLDNLRTSQSHLDKSEYQVDQLTPHIKELQEVVNTLHDAQDFQGLETASCSVPIQIPSVQAVFRVFLVIAAQAETFQNTEVRQSTWPRV